LSKRKLTQVEAAELTAMLEDGKELDATIRAATAKLDKYKKRIRELAKECEFPVTEGHSVYFNHPTEDSAFRVTFTEAGAKLDPVAFRKAVGDKVFLQTVKVKQVEFLPDKWEDLRSREVVKDSQLKDCIVEPEPKAPSVSVVKRKG